MQCIFIKLFVIVGGGSGVAADWTHLLCYISVGVLLHIGFFYKDGFGIK